jgi:hypothetical protein
MNFDLHSSLAFLDLQPWSIAIIVPMVGMIFAGFVIIVSAHFNHRRQELWHETARIALEKGQPLPAIPGAFDSQTQSTASNQPRWRGYLIGGLINIAVGAGIFFALGSIPNPAFNIGFFGFIPGFIGVALLLGAVIEAMASRRK